MSSTTFIRVLQQAKIKDFLLLARSQVRQFQGFPQDMIE
ncbi:hypothetical protein HMPREF9257_1101 [Eremococcus coleocola ACS-139-V-Col8]|uniref:Uncharacterized protein n=1 Tax=Eremococcus coleocola ACS-139-V-Col8 TaxID=908337 RepID=E4KNQ7_9LACT|nr:hypothetical protein HMPREF9257_1101 [Eremococcus coleocola ACS-139-V-Col8]